MWLAGLSIVVNGLSVLIVKSDAENNMNMKSAYLHLFSDMLTSVAVLVGGALMYYFNLYWVDSVISIAIAVYLMYTSGGLLFTTLKVLMQSTPKHLDFDEVNSRLTENSKVVNIHHVHAWQLTDSDVQFSAHVELSENMSQIDSTRLMRDLKQILKSEFSINHATLEAEFDSNHVNDLVYDEREVHTH